MAENKKTYTADELSQLAREKYNREEFDGDELDMVQAAVRWAIRQDRTQHMQSIEELKTDAFKIEDPVIREQVMMYNGALANAQTAIVDAGW